MTRLKAWFQGGAVALSCALVSACALGESDDRTGDPAGDVDDDASPDLASKFVRADEPIAGRYIVVLEAPKDPGARRAMNVGALVNDLADGYVAAVGDTWEHALTGFAAEMDEADALALSADPRVAYVQEDGVVWASATQTGATWGLDRLDQASLPLNGSYTYANNGAGTTVYVIDTGIRLSHNDFGGRASHGFTSINDGQGSNDCNGHGTHVAGTVGGNTWGVAKGANLVAVRVLDCNGSGSDSGVISGINWVAQNHAPRAVINMSLGGGASTASDNAVRNAHNAGVTVVVAAGNENQDACRVSPARAPEAITVASSTSSDGRSSFSNWGTCTDIFAPGSNITSAARSSNTASTTMSGTSMASPHVAGAAALYLAANPNATPTQVTNALTGGATANKISSVNGSPNRLLNVSFIGGGGSEPPPPPPPPPPSEGTPRTGSTSGSLAKNAWFHNPELAVLAGTTITVRMTGTGDPDLYVRFGAQPTTTAYACRPYLNGATETCTLTVPAGATRAFVSVRGYTASTYTLNASWVQP